MCRDGTTLIIGEGRGKARPTNQIQAMSNIEICNLLDDNDKYSSFASSVFDLADMFVFSHGIIAVNYYDIET